MKRYLVLGLVLCLALPGTELRAQTLEQDRRIEEEKREELRPTVTLPGIPKEKVEGEGAAPVPQPIEALYFADLAQKRIAYRYDAAKSLVILMGVDEEYIDLASQVAHLQGKKFLPRRFQETFDPMEPLRKGVAAYLFQQALGIKGGIALHLFGPSERHALKELAFQGIMSPGNVDDLVSGEELVQIVTQAAQYKLRQEQPRQEEPEKKK